MLNPKRKGTRNEHRTMRLLEAAGYSCLRSAASLSEFDVVAIEATDVLLVQVKTNRWPDTAEMEGLKLFRCPANARKIVHRWKDRSRLPDVKELP